MTEYLSMCKTTNLILRTENYSFNLEDNTDCIFRNQKTDNKALCFFDYSRPLLKKQEFYFTKIKHKQIFEITGNNGLQNQNIQRTNENEDLYFYDFNLNKITKSVVPVAIYCDYQRFHSVVIEVDFSI